LALPTVAIPVIPLVHTPPDVVQVSVVVADAQTALAPEIAATVGRGFTVTALVATDVPHEFVTEYEISVLPAATPETIPEVPTVAINVLPLLQTPPVVALLNVVVAEGQTVAVPVIVPAAGFGLTVII
jgi:hypothetical protein